MRPFRPRITWTIRVTNLAIARTTTLERNYYTYILTNKTHTVLYTGVTSDLVKRIWQHRNHIFPKSFTSRYKVCKLIYFECSSDINAAIWREKKIKGKTRKNKIKLISTTNPDWNDLAREIGLESDQTLSVSEYRNTQSDNPRTSF